MAEEVNPFIKPFKIENFLLGISCHQYGVLRMFIGNISSVIGQDNLKHGILQLFHFYKEKMIINSSSNPYIVSAKFYYDSNPSWQENLQRVLTEYGISPLDLLRYPDNNKPDEELFKKLGLELIP